MVSSEEATRGRAVLQALRERDIRQERHGERPPAVPLQGLRTQLHGDPGARQAAGDEGAGGPALRPGLSLRSVGTFRPAGSRAALDSIGFLAGEGGWPDRNAWAHDEATFSRRTAADTLEPWACTCGPPSGGTRTVRWCATTRSPRTSATPGRATSRPGWCTASVAPTASTARRGPLVRDTVELAAPAVVLEVAE